jgi:hypothetical protein
MNFFLKKIGPWAAPGQVATRPIRSSVSHATKPLTRQTDPDVLASLCKDFGFRVLEIQKHHALHYLNKTL